MAQQQEKGPQAHLCGVSKPPSAPPRPPEGGHHPHSSSTSHVRPRRRLPSVPSAGGSSCGARSRSSPRPSDMSDPSDSSLETESFLRDTESVVSAMQVKVSIHSNLLYPIQPIGIIEFRSHTHNEESISIVSLQPKSNRSKKKFRLSLNTLRGDVSPPPLLLLKLPL